MKKKNLNEGYACESEEQQGHTEHIDIEDFNRYILQFSEEELDEMGSKGRLFPTLLAQMLGVDSKDIKSFKRAGLGWDVRVAGDAMSELDDIMDDNADVLRRLKDSDDDTYTPDTLDDDFMVDDVDDDVDDDMEEWEREGYNSEIAYRNRWRDYQD
jgi:hypothetical protein